MHPLVFPLKQYRDIKFIHGNILTAKARQIASNAVSINIPLNPANSNVFLPAFSTSIKETKVITTFIAPTAIVAFCAAVLSNCAIVKILVEKNMTAFIPDNC